MVSSTAFEGLPGRFCLYYQPELDLRDGSIRACEAMVRWWHPEFGMVRPGLTLDGTRWNERVHGIEEWAVAEVCRQAVGREVVPIVVDEDELAGAAAAVDAGRLVDALERRVVRQRAVAQGDTQRAGDALADRARGDDLRGLQEGELLVDGERALRPGSGRQPDQHDAREPGGGAHVGVRRMRRRPRSRIQFPAGRADGGRTMA